MFLEARTADGTVMQVPITPRNLGLRRAEIEGQHTAFVPTRASWATWPPPITAFTRRNPR
jgi:hypothetical protein